ncbi:helix-turn-helix domain-containing protein [Clostridium sardiniense]|uniref:Helix-turn-helix domain-containing protein n=1 Tax=Clostridium sardiniense TaxID=29369 RepID=A0ABS7L097_CLOSR|nr:helix-turn-helix transcriptional regulator [Clostridium sardiniense]MBY0756312.1 helix-turn-helix domain-containing protein [Clostridium sardiniense]MDQ0461468.1 transcriptional regulator with XRE-family HTH domain [Clostridium sardiniense]
MKERVNLADNLRMYRAKNRFSQVELARRSGVSHRTIVDSERNIEHRLSFEGVLKLAEGLNISLENLIVEKF